MNRRQVLRWISLFGLGLTEFTFPGLFARAQTDNSRKKTRPGYPLVGCGHQGLNLLEQIIRSDCADVKYLCDVDPAHLNAARRLFMSHHSPPVAIADFRTLLGAKSIDAFIIATPNHWHTPMAISAMNAGHDVYLEKPVSHSYEETLKLLDVQKRTGKKVGRYSVHKKTKGDHFRSSIDMGKHILNFSQSLKGQEGLNAPLRLGLPYKQMIHYINYCYRSSAGETLLTKNALLQKLNAFPAPLKTRSPFALSALEKLLPADANFFTNKIHFELNDLTHFQPDVELLRNHYREGWFT